MNVSLKEVTRQTLRAVCKLDAGDDATQVAPNAVSIAEASFYDEAWFRAIYDDDVLVGFVMLYDPTLAEEPDEPDFFLWRLMIDKAHPAQRAGACGGQAADRPRAYATGSEETARFAYEQGRCAGAFL